MRTRQAEVSFYRDRREEHRADKRRRRPLLHGVHHSRRQAKVLPFFHVKGLVELKGCHFFLLCRFEIIELGKVSQGKGRRRVFAIKY